MIPLFELLEQFFGCADDFSPIKYRGKGRFARFEGVPGQFSQRFGESTLQQGEKGVLTGVHPKAQHLE